MSTQIRLTPTKSLLAEKAINEFLFHFDPETVDNDLATLHNSAKEQNKLNKLSDNRLNDLEFFTKKLSRFINKLTELKK